jgi:AraC family transcriptional regulator
MEIIWNTQAGETPVLFKRQAIWQGIKILHGDVLAGEIPEHTPDVHEFNITLAGRLRVEKQTSAGRRVVQHASPGNLCLTPSGQPIRASWNERIENLALTFKPDFVERIALENKFSGGFELTEVYKTRDPLVVQIGLALLDELCAEDLTDPIYADTLSQSLVIHLLKHYTTARIAAVEPKGGLSGYKLRRVKEFIRENLDQDLTLAEIAEAADLSRYHFSRAFRQSTGTTPQKFLMEQRIERAKVLLTDRDLAIVDISLQTGFKNQSHFTTLFRKFTKLTPKSWRELKQA